MTNAEYNPSPFASAATALAGTANTGVLSGATCIPQRRNCGFLSDEERIGYNQWLEQQSNRSSRWRFRGTAPIFIEHLGRLLDLDTAIEAGKGITTKWRILTPL